MTTHIREQHAYGELLDREGNPLWCEQCGEAHQTTQTTECGLCDDCFASTMRDTLTPVLGYKPCCFPVWVGCPEYPVPALCLEVSGEEHTH